MLSPPRALDDKDSGRGPAQRPRGPAPPERRAGCICKNPLPSHLLQAVQEPGQRTQRGKKSMVCKEVGKSGDDAGINNSFNMKGPFPVILIYCLT